MDWENSLMPIRWNGPGGQPQGPLSYFWDHEVRQYYNGSGVSPAEYSKLFFQEIWSCNTTEGM